MSKEILEKLDELNSGIVAVQAKNDDLQSKYDGLDQQAIKEDSIKLGEMAEALQTQKSLQEEKDKATAEFQASVEKYISRPGAGESKSEGEDLMRNYKSGLNAYLQEVKKMDNELVGDAYKHCLKSLLPSKTDQQLDVIKTLLVGSNPDGGYLVFPEMITSFKIDRIFETSPLRSVARVISTASESVQIPIDDDEAASGGWVGECTPRTETDTAKVGMETITTHEQFAEPVVSQKFLDDASINVEEFVNAKTLDILTRTENTAFVLGDGSQKPRGFLTYPAWAVASTKDIKGEYETGKIEQVKSGINGEVSADAYILLQTALLDDYQSRAVFMMQRGPTWCQTLILKDGQGQYLLQPGNLGQGFTPTILGKSIVFANDMEKPDVDSKSVAYGDFSVGYTIVDRFGIRVLRDPFTGKPKVKFYTTKRVGGAVTNFQSIKILKLAA